MLYTLLAIQILTLVALFVLFARMRSTDSGANQTTEDPRLAQLFAADLGAHMTALTTRMTVLDTRSHTLDQYLRDQVTQLRSETAAASVGLRSEVLGNVTTLGDTLRSSLEGFRANNTDAADRLRSGVDTQMNTLAQRIAAFTADNTRHQADSREALHASLQQLRVQQVEQHEKLRAAMQERLDKLNTDNTAKLEEMRQTVDEKLHATLQNRLTESFGQVTDQLTKVHAGLGEMTKLSAGVDDLSRIFTNVKSRGTIGEVMLESLLKQMLASSQYEKNVKPKPGSAEVVEFVVKLPTPNGEVLLPIDSKFPREAWERLESAYQNGTELTGAGKAFETAIRNEGKKICEKYIAPPRTTTFAIMFLPTEGLYAEVMRRDGLQTDIQQNCHVTIAGPSTLSAILNSFQMGFHMLQMQEKGDEVWKVLANARKEFGTFENLMDKMTTDIGKVQGTIDKLGVRTRAINRTLRDVSVEASNASPALAATTAFDGFLPMLAASEDE